MEKIAAAQAVQGARLEAQGAKLDAQGEKLDVQDAKLDTILEVLRGQASD